MLKCQHFNIYEQDKFLSQLSWAWKKFYNLEPSLNWVFFAPCLVPWFRLEQNHVNTVSEKG